MICVKYILLYVFMEFDGSIEGNCVGCQHKLLTQSRSDMWLFGHVGLLQILLLKMNMY